MRLGWGVDLTLHLTASSLTALGHTVKLYTANHDGSFARAPYDIIHTPVVPHPLFPRFEWRARRYIDFFNKEPNDVYLIATQPWFYYSWFLDKPCINYEFGIVPTTGFSWRKKLMWAYMKYTQFWLYHPKAAAIVSNSDFTKSALPWFVQAKTETVYHGVEHYDPLHPDHDILFPEPLLEPDPYNPNKPREVPVDKRSNEELRIEFRRKHGFTDKNIVGLYVGRINPVDQPYKGTQEMFDTLPGMMRDDYNLKWVMVGLGTDRDVMRCRDAGITPLLNLPDWKMRQVFAGCDIYASASKWEGFNLPVMEAQYFGKPVIVYNMAAHPEVVLNGKSGYLVNSNDEFKARLVELMKSAELRGKLGAEGKKWAGIFTWRRCAQQFENLFESVVAARKSQG
jgi:glycosyltransferase involved in cell wall biosynthesis